MEGDVIIMKEIFSGLVGAIGAQLLYVAWSGIRRWLEYRAMKKAIVSEAKYNIEIIDEILNGVVKGSGSFKRLSVEYFKQIRTEIAKYRRTDLLMAALSRVCIDIELFNREVDYVFSGTETTEVFQGVMNDKAVLVRRETEQHDISATVTAAREGVVGSLKHLINVVNGGK